MYRVFFGCNYNDKRIKTQFDSLKDQLEDELPVECVLIDKQSGQSAKDLWKEIRRQISEAEFVFFDVTAFRPNVILELGYALSIKNESQIFITFRTRKSKGKHPAWLLSDVGHLNRHEYANVARLEEFVREQLKLSDWIGRFKTYNKKCEEDTNAPDKYQAEGFKVLKALRDEGPKSETQIKNLIRGSACRVSTLTRLLRGSKLVKRGRGRNGRFDLSRE